MLAVFFYNDFKIDFKLNWSNNLKWKGRKQEWKSGEQKEDEEKEEEKDEEEGAEKEEELFSYSNESPNNLP